MLPILDGPIPTTPEALTPEWVTAALREARVLHSETSVAGFTCTILGDGKGFTGQVGRLAIEYDGPTDAPPTAIVKFPASDPGLRAEMVFYNIYPQEHGFYTELAGRQPFSVPTFYSGRVDAASGDSCLLMEELTDANPFDIFGGLSVEEARIVLAKLAEFHARFWESPILDAYDWLRPFNYNAEGRAQRFLEAADPVLERLRDRLPDDFVQAIQVMRDRVDVVRALLSRNPRTLIHGDFHPNNLFWRDGPDGRDVVVLDWQIVASGRPERDLMYFLSSSLTAEVRRSHQNDLIAFYAEQLAENGVEGHALETCKQGYRLALLDLVYFATIVLNILDFTVNEEAEMILDLILERWGGSVTDFDLADLLESIPEGAGT